MTYPARARGDPAAGVFHREFRMSMRKFAKAPAFLAAAALFAAVPGTAEAQGGQPGPVGRRLYPD